MCTERAMRTHARNELSVLEPSVLEAVCVMGTTLHRLGIVPMDVRWRGTSVTVSWYEPTAGHVGEITFANVPADVLYWIQADDIIAATALLPNDLYPPD